MPRVPFLRALSIKESILLSETLAFWASKSLLAQKARIIFLTIVFLFFLFIIYYPQRYSFYYFHYEILLCVRYCHLKKLIWCKRTIIPAFILSHGLFLQFNTQMQGGLMILRPAFSYRYLFMKLTASNLYLSDYTFCHT